MVWQSPTSNKAQKFWRISKSAPAVGNPMRNDYDNYRKSITLKGVSFNRNSRFASIRDCDHHTFAYRPEAEAGGALPLA